MAKGVAVSLVPVLKPVPLVILALALSFLPASARAQSLVDFYRQALASSPTLRTSQFGIEVAKAQQDLATSKLLPSVSFTAGADRNKDNESDLPSAFFYDGRRTALQASQALFDVASYFKLQASRFTVAQSEQDSAAARAALGADVVDRYMTVLQAGDELTQLEAEKQSVEGQLKRLRFMRERQLVKVTDVYELEAYYQGLLTKEIEARGARSVALERLRESSGMASQNVAPLARDTFDPVPGPEAEWVDKAADANPTVAALKLAIEAAQKQISSAYADHLPLVSLNASRTGSNLGYDNRVSPPYTVTTIGIQVTVPLFEGGRVQAEVRDARARLEIAREKYESARREIERNARTAYLGAMTDFARIGSTGEEVRSLERVMEAQQRAYELGVATIVDTLTARQKLFKSRSDRAKVRYDYIRDFTSLRMHAGRLTDADIEEIDAWLDKSARRRDFASRDIARPDGAGSVQ